MRRRAAAGLAVLFLFTVGFASTATNAVPPSHAGQGATTITANDLAPPECAALDLWRVRVTGRGGRSLRGELVLGTGGTDRLRGSRGADCIVGGAGNDRINGRRGADICIGGPGNDRFRNCETVYP